MATTIGALALKISATTAGLKADLDKGLGLIGRFAHSANATLAGTLSGIGGAANKLASGGDPFEMLKNSAMSFAGKIPYVGGLLVGLGEIVEGFAGKLMAVIDGIVETRNNALKLGTDVKTMSELMAVAGGDAEVMFKGLEKLNHKLGDAATGSKEAARSFARLGLDAKELAGLNLRERVEQLADTFGRLQSPIERSHFLFELFGKSGAELAPILAKGRAGMDDVIATATRLGVVVDEKVVQQAKEAKKAMKEFEMVMKGVWTQITVQALPFLRSLQEELKSSGATAGDTAEQMINFAEGVMTSAVWTYNAVVKIINVYRDMQNGLKTLAEGVLKLLPGLTWELGDAMHDDIIAGINAPLKEINLDGLRQKIDAFRRKAAAGHAPIVGDAIDLEAQARMNDLAEELGKKLEGLRSPAEKFREEIGKINEAWKLGAIDLGQYNALAVEITEQMLKQQSLKNTPTAGLTLGTAAEFSARAAFDRGAGVKTVDQQIADYLKDQATREKEKAVRDKQLLDAFNRNKFAVVEVK